MDEMASTGRRDAGWGAAARTAFLDTLALSGDVARSAEAAGRTHASAYALRRHDPAFADAWEEALNAAYARIEDELLARAVDPRAREGDAFDQALALKMLARHETRRARPNAPREAVPRAASMEEVEQALLGKLAAFAKRLPAKT
ncbi:hypothetical protein PX554_01530 [Sphingomonas sp. H39-1-10]|uniref:hypothetical protein n=1 Tax=Sphingomonas TaxID=13687 RepID=UPI00088097AB|nr:MULTISPECIES: hypothetical protein [Sphingomonas]MDF0486795.1 hypothetical protein [Sphingomonas pollutisoli]SDA35168.1 hypothetical protein SAMN03159340_03186 [Sphingomonas sp. NFR15]